MKYAVYLGMGGVSVHENKKVQSIGKLFSISMHLIAFVLLIQWYLQEKNLFTHHIDKIFWIILAIFTTEFAILIFLVNNKPRYLKQNWFNFILIAITLLFIVHPDLDDFIARFVLPIFALLVLSPSIIHLMKSALQYNRLLTTILVIVGVIFVSGFLISAIDPAIQSPFEGFWWAWVSMSTVGYGDIVPVTWFGRVFASILIFLGLGFFAILTANFSAYFLSQNTEAIEKEHKDVKALLKESEKTFSKEEQILKSINMLKKEVKELREELTDKTSTKN